MAEREVARVAGKQVPRRGEHDPVEDEVEKRLIERRQAHEGHRRESRADPQEDGNRLHEANRFGRMRSSAMSSVNDTSGAHAGAISAMVSASLTPMMMPAKSGPSGLPRPPIMTAANTTPIQA